MTVTMGMILNTANAAAGTAERGGKDAATGGQGFDEALAARGGLDRHAARGSGAAGTGRIMEPDKDASAFGEPRELPEVAEDSVDGCSHADLPITSIEAVLRALQLRSAAATSGPDEVATTRTAETGDGFAPPGGATAVGKDDMMPVRIHHPHDRRLSLQASLANAQAVPASRPNDRSVFLQHQARLGESSAPRTMDAGRGSPLSHNADGRLVAAPPAGQGTVVQAGADEALAALRPSSDKTLVTGTMPGEARSMEPHPGREPASGLKRPVFDTSGNRMAAVNRTTPRIDPLEAIAGRLNILGHSTALPPVPAASLPPAATVASLVSAMDANPSWQAAAAEMNAPTGQRAPGLSGPVSTLRIQLHPAELGMVTARLTASGSQLSIEIQTESNDARQRLTADSEAIVKALRAIGYDVDKVTIQQAPQGGSQQQGQATGRDPFGANQQAQEDESTKEQDRSGGNGNQQQRSRHGGGEAAADRAGGGLYI